MKRIFLIVLVSTSILTPSVAFAKTKPNPHATYALPTHVKKCRTGFVKKTERHKIKGKSVRYVACVWQPPRAMAPVVTPTIVPGIPATFPPITTPTPVPPVPSFTYVAHIDPSFTQSAANPKAVTYTYTAGATETLGVQVLDLAQANQLPSGILDLYSDGMLACSVNVGNATTGGKCAVTYSTYGKHTVVTEYIPSGVTPVTETDSEDVEPFSTSVAISTPLLGSTVNIDDYSYQVVTIPVTVSGLTGSLGTTGTISLTNTDATGESCQPLTYNSSLGSATTNCTAEVEDDPNVATSWTPSVSFTGDANYSSSGVTGPIVVIPIAPAPTVDDVTVTIQCDESGGFCTEYNSAPETTDARVNVFAGNPIYDQSPGIGTVTFTSADHLTICSAAVGPSYLGPDSAGRCVGDGGPFEGPIQVSYSGGSIETGDTLITVYSSATTSGGSN